MSIETNSRIRRDSFGSACEEAKFTSCDELLNELLADNPVQLEAVAPAVRQNQIPNHIMSTPWAGVQPPQTQYIHITNKMNRNLHFECIQTVRSECPCMLLCGIDRNHDCTTPNSPHCNSNTNKNNIATANSRKHDSSRPKGTHPNLKKNKQLKTNTTLKAHP